MEIGKLTATTLGQTLRFDLRPGVPCSVGRSSRCTVKVRDPKMSREHCRLELVNGKVLVTDLASSHGLMFRGSKCAGFEIEVGDGFHVGQTFLRFEARETLAAADLVTAPVPQAALAPAPLAPDDDDDDEEDYEDERAGDADLAAQYPAVSGHESRAGRPRRGRRRARSSGLVAVLGQILLCLTTVITLVAVMLALKHHNPNWDVYRVLEWLQPRKP